MATPRSSFIWFIPGPGEKAVQINPHEFAAGKGFSWSEEIEFTEEDDKKITTDALTLDVSEGIDQLTSQQQADYWNKILQSSQTAFNQVALYDTLDPHCGLGLVALQSLKFGQFMRYPGQWIQTEDYLVKSMSYSFTIYDKNQRNYGHVDGAKIRHFASFALHGWGKSELDHYEFDSPTIKAQVATSNLAMNIMLRPQSVKVGPPFILTLVTTRDINAGEPLLWTYCSTFFLDLANHIPECFFNKKNAAILNPQTYKTKDEIYIRLINPTKHESVTHKIKKSEIDDLYVNALNPKTFAITHYYLPASALKTAYEAYPRRRFLNFEER